MTALQRLLGEVRELSEEEAALVFFELAAARGWTVVLYGDGDIRERVTRPGRHVPEERWDELVERVKATESWQVGLGDVLIQRGEAYLDELVDRVVDEVVPSALEAPCGSG